ncbi:HAMP domain-containing sensor histidine kinase [Saccharibacillus sp. JS10]|uniref:sensor histidine kinase n=1 Tax=Saccharibacillus sp. JS10 TaxID=2950552 RepID=UPI00210B1DD5|nr:HAMP domain-containing sensor histidine kinase [Saccharibacillus sp. JS10]MCQ4085347.1 HAMP domain-containing histidine kinase [Saccharibacillus sp. JS10]
MKISIKLKFTLFLAALLTLTVGVLSILVLQGTERSQKQQIEDTMARQTQLANLRVRQEFYTQEPRLNPTDFLQQQGVRLSDELSDLSGMPVTLYDAKGDRIGTSLPGEIPPLEGDPTGASSFRYAIDGQVAYWQQGSSLEYFAPLEGPEGQMGVIRFRYSIATYQAAYADTQELFVRIGFGVVGLSFVLGYLFFNRFAAGIIRLKKAADAIRRGEFIHHAPLKRRGDELGQLGEGLYEMSNAIERNIQIMQDEQHKLKLAVEKLQSLERQQKEYIGNISHEFKTPLTSIKAYVELLEMYGDDPELLEEARSNIGKESQRLYEMVEKVLRLAELEKYDFEIQAEVMDPEEALQDVIGRMRGKAERFDLTLHLELPKSKGIKQDANSAAFPLWVDRESFMHIFVNLLDNSIKYNHPGGEVRICLEPRPASHMQEQRSEVEYLAIRVSNTGPAIPEEVRARIFEPFFTVNRDRARQSGGSGLGLSLVKRLVEAQNGTIELISSDEQGTVFELTFPIMSEDSAKKE